MFRLRDLLGHNVTTEISPGVWVAARPYLAPWRWRLNDAWEVLQGRADAFTWPTASDPTTWCAADSRPMVSSDDGKCERWGGDTTVRPDKIKAARAETLRVFAEVDGNTSPRDAAKQAADYMHESIFAATRPNVQRYQCHQCGKEFSGQPTTWSISGIPARTFFFCRPECLTPYLQGDGCNSAENP